MKFQMCGARKSCLSKHQHEVQCAFPWRAWGKNMQLRINEIIKPWMKLQWKHEASKLNETIWNDKDYDYEHEMPPSILQDFRKIETSISIVIHIFKQWAHLSLAKRQVLLIGNNRRLRQGMDCHIKSQFEIHSWNLMTLGPQSRRWKASRNLKFCSGHILHSVAPFQHRFLSTCHTQDLVTALPAYGKFMSNNSHLSHTNFGNGTHQFGPNISNSLSIRNGENAVPVAGIARNSTLAIVRTDLQSSQKAAHTWHQSQDDTKWY